MSEPFEDLSFDSIRGEIERLRKEIESNFDVRDKKVGDRVKIWDFSANKIKSKPGKKEKKISATDVYFKENSAIIVEEGLSIEFKFNYAEELKLTKEEAMLIEDINLPPFNLDILIRYPDGTEVYTCSDFVKRIDNYEK